MKVFKIYYRGEGIVTKDDIGNVSTNDLFGDHCLSNHIYVSCIQEAEESEVDAIYQDYYEKVIS